MKPALLRPRAIEDQRQQVRYYREQAGSALALRLERNLRKAIAELQRQPGIGSPGLGQEIGIDWLRTWAVAGFPLLYLYIERDAYLDVIRLLGQRQALAALLAEVV